ncbi:MAG: hypothetical protein QM625_22745 [Ralstonia sp.]|uniref:hypothetical protein n=1 Tax=Ralstonia TaxID=48736 RepID=UPI0015CAC5DB|nr:hypothetical protein [Ralstonia pickettii]MBA9877457.1 hypothetical protein [Ralstonia pickettii]MBA9881709.1 hypothetical protein [Ralstonia pickettii]MBA9887074.1 hypothetical protein [Ralstonia pickettii]MBA9891826.1 hypothetical protein [Ralstonia pickettii]MBA9923640.1 hypothetical protein [Ralstonia pickettii]
MKNDDVLTGIALVGLAFAAFQFMRPRTVAAAPAQGAAGAPRPISGFRSSLPAWSSLASNLGDLGNTLWTGGSAAGRGMVQGIFAPGDSALTVGNFDIGNGPLEQAAKPGFTLGELGSDNGAYTFGSPVNIDPTQYGY